MLQAPSGILSHPTGNQNSREAAKAFALQGQLSLFITSLALNYDAFSFLGSNAKEFARRDFSEIGGPVCSAAPLREITRLLSGRLGLRQLCDHETGWASIDNVSRCVDKYTAAVVERKPRLGFVYAYEDAAVSTFETAKGNLACVYELPIGYWRAHHYINKAEIQAQPKWGGTWRAVKDSSLKLARKDRELELADLVVVPSKFVANSLNLYPKALPEVRVIPYGFPEPIRPHDRNWYDGNRPLRLLYVGGLSQRKGLSYLCQAVRAFGNRVSVTIIGLGSAASLVREELPNAVFLGSLPHSDVLEQMREHDVLLFPSLFEGFGLVVTEAMSQGMVVISTDRTGLPDISNDDCAICVPAADADAIQAAIDMLLSAPDKVRLLGTEALARAASYTWADYRERLYYEVISLVGREHV